MPGILCSAYDPADTAVEAKWQLGLQWVKHHPEHVLEQHTEPGFHIACIYHPEVCQAPRTLITEQHVLAYYGNIYDDDQASMPDGDPICLTLLDRFIKGGIETLKHLNGRYDIVIWDRRTRVLNHTGDRFGANRHYLLKRAGALHIACEVKALAPHLDRIEVDPAGLASMLSFGYHLGDLTILKDVKCLHNARHLEYRASEDQLSIDRYWNYPYGETEPLSGTEAELASELHDLLLNALKRQIKGVKKILLPISGGLDSRTMAGLLAQSGFTGEVLAYSYGQPSSRDVRYGRAIARKLGYRHVTIPTPKDFITRHLEKAAWQFDAEWPSDSNWGARFSHTHPALGDIHGYKVLSGFMGDVVLGSDKYHYRSKAGDIPLNAKQLSEIFFDIHRDMPIDGLLDPISSSDAENAIAGIVRGTFEPLQDFTPFFAILRSEFIHRQRRHTATVPQSVEHNLQVITPFLDRDVVDFSTRIPLGLFHNKLLYKHMIRNHLPDVAAVPLTDTGLPLINAPIQQAIKWRVDRLMKYFPRWHRALNRRNEFFDFHGGVFAVKEFFRKRIEALSSLSPPLLPGAAEQRMEDLLTGSVRSTEQATTLLPPALFIRTLRQALSSYADIVQPKSKIMDGTFINHPAPNNLAHTD